MGGAALARDEVLLGGVTGVLLHSRDGGRSFRSATRPDRKAVASALGLPGARIVLVGAFGAESLDGGALEGMMGAGGAGR